jgi:hypothetical protein
MVGVEMSKAHCSEMLDVVLLFIVLILWYCTRCNADEYDLVLEFVGYGSVLVERLDCSRCQYWAP